MRINFVIILALITFPTIAFSQKRRDVDYDSSRYYQKQILKAYKQAIDSLEKTELFMNYLQFQKRNNNYEGQTFFFNVLHSNYNQFNNSIALSGFDKLKPISYGFGFGYDSKFKHVISDFAISVVFPNTSKKGDETISSSLFNILFDMGYDVLNSNNVSVYPYAGLSARFSALSYTNKGTVNPSYNNISDLLLKSENVNTASIRLGYQLGVGLDVAVSHKKDGNRSLLLFVKAGINQPFAKDRFKIQNITYNPQINKGDWMLSVGIKFVSRKIIFN